MRIALAQINSTVADFKGNSEKILAFARRARDEQKADMVLFPELAVSGCPPLDLLGEKLFPERSIQAVKNLERELPHDIAVGFGYVSRSPCKTGKDLVNVYGIVLNGELVFEQIKTRLAPDGVYNEEQYFEPARSWDVFEYKKERLGFTIGEDLWQETNVPRPSYMKNPVPKLMDKGMSILCVPSASPYAIRKYRSRLLLAAEISRAEDLPVVYINAAGANDDVIFDGCSFVYTPAKPKRHPRTDESTLALYAKPFEEDLVVWDTANVYRESSKTGLDDTSDPFGVELSRYDLDMLEEALVLGIRDYMKKCGFSRAHTGLSGGIDSALVAYLAVRAAGAENFTGISMPSRFSSPGSKDDAAELAANLGCRYEVLPIEECYTAFLSTLKGIFENRPFDITEENIQARIRGLLNMAYSNKFNSMLLNTGNKSEIAMGYCTLYGDTNGALGPIGDIFKTEVFALCRRINERSIAAGGKAIIPQATIDKPPSAELHPDQKDEDSLPPYDVLDAILRLCLRGNRSPEEIVKEGWDRELVKRIVKAIARSEFKRRQLPPALRVSPGPFGAGRKIPVARALYEI